MTLFSLFNEEISRIKDVACDLQKDIENCGWSEIKKKHAFIIIQQIQFSKLDILNNEVFAYPLEFRVTEEFLKEENMSFETTRKYVDILLDDINKMSSNLWKDPVEMQLKIVYHFSLNGKYNMLLENLKVRKKR